MNDLPYIKYYAKTMLVDTLDMPPMVELAHRRLCDYIWAMDGPPPDQILELQSITKITAADWVRVYGGLQRKGWHSVSGMLEHTGAMKTLQAAKADYKEACERTRAATEARRKRNVERNDQRNVDRNVNESEPEPEVPVLTTNKPCAPSLEAVKTKAQFIGLSEVEAERFWNHFEASGWIDKNGHPIVKWENKLATWAADSRAKPLEDKRSVRGAQSVNDIRTVIQAKRSLASELRTKFCSEGPLDHHWSNPPKRLEYIKLMKDAKELERRLSNMA